MNAPVNHNLRLIHDRVELSGSLYMELLPGPYLGPCWNDKSAYVQEEAFAYIEPIIEAQEPRYHHFAVTEITAGAWESILVHFDSVAEQLETGTMTAEWRVKLQFLFLDSESRSFAGGSDTPRHVASLIRETAAWVRRQLQTHVCLSILGI